MTIEKINKKSKWLVKDAFGEYIVITADNWACNGKELCFFIDMTIVAHFLKWISYRKLDV